MTGRFRNRTALISGGSRGIGFSAAQVLASEGAHVVIGGIEPDEVAIATNDLREAGGRADGLASDVREPSSVHNLVALALNATGSIDILVNCAGVTMAGPKLWETAEEDWDRVVDTNLKGPYLLSREVIPHMMEQRHGAIINVASQLAFAAVPGFGAYPASKAGLVHLTRCMALELIAYGIRVNAVCPGATDTPQFRGAFPNGRGVLGTLDDFTSRHPIGRIGRPAEIAACIAFLASDDASFVVGAALVADGGYGLR